MMAASVPIRGALGQPFAQDRRDLAHLLDLSAQSAAGGSHAVHSLLAPGITIALILKILPPEARPDAAPRGEPVAARTVPDDVSFRGVDGQIITPERIARFLAFHRSPLLPHARRIVATAKRYHVDPRWIVAIAGPLPQGLQRVGLGRAERPAPLVVVGGRDRELHAALRARIPHPRSRSHRGALRSLRAHLARDDAAVLRADLRGSALLGPQAKRAALLGCARGTEGARESGGQLDEARSPRSIWTAYGTEATPASSAIA
jgi:hypothetical protein